MNGVGSTQGVVSSPTTEAAERAARTAQAAVNVTSVTKPVAKPGPVKKVKQYSVALVEKNTYNTAMNALVAKGAEIVAITVNPDVRNSFDVHYYILG
jgi:hypothetical protein